MLPHIPQDRVVTPPPRRPTRSSRRCSRPPAPTSRSRLFSTTRWCARGPSGRTGGASVRRGEVGVSRHSWWCLGRRLSSTYASNLRLARHPARCSAAAARAAPGPVCALPTRAPGECALPTRTPRPRRCPLSTAPSGSRLRGNPRRPPRATPGPSKRTPSAESAPADGG